MASKPCTPGEQPENESSTHLCLDVYRPEVSGAWLGKPRELHILQKILGGGSIYNIILVQLLQGSKDLLWDYSRKGLNAAVVPGFVMKGLPLFLRLGQPVHSAFLSNCSWTFSALEGPGALFYLLLAEVQWNLGTS